MSPAPRAERSAAEERRIRRAVTAGITLLRVLGPTWRLRVDQQEPWQALHAKGLPAVLTCWHGELLPLLWAHRGRSIAVLVSEHRDGEIIARVAARLGFRTVRGSTSRGGGRALLALVRLLQEGTHVAITPDGPRGPPHQYAPGTLVAAHRAGAPIIPITAEVRRAWRLRSWDRFIIPQPFARIRIAYGAPTAVSAPDARAAAALAPEFADMHHAVARRARS